MKLRHLLPLLISLTSYCLAASHALVIQTDFGTKDGAVAAMKGVAFGVSSELHVFDLSHQNTPFHVWEAAYRLNQAAPFWPEGTVFVSVVDPGVGTERHSVVLKTKNGQYFVGPDNGTWTLIAESLGVASVRQIDETKNRRHGSEKSYTFHGRDVYAFVGARLAAGVIQFEDVGPELKPEVVAIAYEHARFEGGEIKGNIPALDYQYGNVWTNIEDSLFAKLEPKWGDRFEVTILKGDKVVSKEMIPYCRTFGDVPEGAPLLYVNSLMNVAVALNMGDYAKSRGIDFGGEWRFILRKQKP